MPRAIDPLLLSMDQRSELQRWLVALGTPQQVALRCRIILAVAAGKTEMAVAAENGVNPLGTRSACGASASAAAAPRRFGRLLQGEGGNPVTM